MQKNMKYNIPKFYKKGDTIMFWTIRASGESRVTTKDDKNGEKFAAIIEVVVMIFITTFIPPLIKLGRPPVNLTEIWSELLVALLASAYAYMRMRGIDPTPEPNDD